MTRINLPTDEATIRGLKCGDRLEISGVLLTARDAAHAYLTEEDRPEMKKMLQGSFIYHCGPIMKKDGSGNWTVISAGPTTSIREEIYEADVIERYGVRGVIGKGGMGKRTLAACEKYGAVYLHAVGGAGALVASSIIRVRDVFMLDEFGVPEALWELEVKDFPVVVSMDSSGNSLHDAVERDSGKVHGRLLGIE